MKIVYLSTILLGSIAATALALDPPNTVRSFSGVDGLQAASSPSSTPWSTPSLISGGDLSACGLGAQDSSGRYIVNLGETYDLSNCISTTEGPDPTFVTSSCGAGLTSGGSYSPPQGTTLGSCVIQATAGGQGFRSDSAPVVIDILRAAALTSQTITIPDSASLPSSTNPLYRGGSHTISVDGAGSQVSVSSTSSTVCSYSVDGNGDVVVTATITSGTGTCTLEITAQRDPGAGLGQSNTELVSLTVSGLQAQPDSVAVTTPTETLYLGGTYTAAVDNQAGNGAITWSVSPESAGICSVDANTGEVTAGTTSGSCDVIATIAADSTYAEQSITQTVQVSELQAQPDAVAINTPDGDIYVGGTYTASLENQGGAGQITWSVSDESSTGDICTVDETTGVVTGGTATGVCTLQASIAADSDAYYAAATLDPVTFNVAALREIDPFDTDQVDWLLRVGSNYTSANDPGWPAQYAGDGQKMIYFLAPSDYEGEMTITDPCGITSNVSDRYTLSGVTTLRRYPSNNNPSHDRLLFMRLNAPSTAQDCALTVNMPADTNNGYEAREVTLSVPYVARLSRVNTDGLTAFVDNKPAVNRCIAGEANAVTDSMLITGGVPPFRISKRLLSEMTRISQYRSYVQDIGGNQTTTTYGEVCDQLGYSGVVCQGILGSQTHFGETMRAEMNASISGRRVDLSAHFDVLPRLNGGLWADGTVVAVNQTAWLEIADANNRKTSMNVNISCDTVNTGVGQEFTMTLDSSALNSATTYEVPLSAFATTAGGTVNVTLESLTTNVCSVSGRTITALAGNATCSIRATNAGFSIGATSYGPASVLGSIEISNSNSALGWSDGEFVWSNCSVVSANDMGSTDPDDVFSYSCPNGKEWAPSAFVETNACDGREAWSYSQPIAMGHMHSNDGIWQNGGNANSLIRGDQDNYVATIRTHRFYRENWRSAFNADRTASWAAVSTKVCAVKN